jgi:hypothetical protein
MATVDRVNGQNVFGHMLASFMHPVVNDLGQIDRLTRDIIVAFRQALAVTSQNLSTEVAALVEARIAVLPPAEFTVPDPDGAGRARRR